MDNWRMHSVKNWCIIWSKIDNWIIYQSLPYIILLAGERVPQPKSGNLKLTDCRLTDSMRELPDCRLLLEAR